ncbi:hypothetical protein SAY87_001596 [Trapa incisa]|uniref:Uncharacterized protein n=1 Tax=Trapa incisa TaxID=236973 RepID=A0AAN7JV96_9MYRT|nr:hypothetical protein SAY87_001596 [Trapa incisa]
MGTSLPLTQFVFNGSFSFRTPKISRLQLPQFRLPWRPSEFRTRNCGDSPLRYNSSAALLCRAGQYRHPSELPLATLISACRLSEDNFRLRVYHFRKSQNRGYACATLGAM